MLHVCSSPCTSCCPPGDGDKSLLHVRHKTACALPGAHDVSCCRQTCAGTAEIVGQGRQAAAVDLQAVEVSFCTWFAPATPLQQRTLKDALLGTVPQFHC